MGLAASQARLLSITSRLSDNELRAQLINNQKIRLATESSNASDTYVAALNNAKMMFANYDKDNNKSYQDLTFNALTAFNPYNNQYGLANQNGNILVSETDAYNFQRSSDLDGFLEQYGLKYETSFFNENNLGKYVDDAKGLYLYSNYDENGNEIPVYLTKPNGVGYTLEELKAMYLGEELDGIKHIGYDKIPTDEKFIAYTNAMEDLLIKYDTVSSIAAPHVNKFIKEMKGKYEPYAWYKKPVNEPATETLETIPSKITETTESYMIERYMNELNNILHSLRGQLGPTAGTVAYDYLGSFIDQANNWQQSNTSDTEAVEQDKDYVYYDASGAKQEVKHATFIGRDSADTSRSFLAVSYNDNGCISSVVKLKLNDDGSYTRSDIADMSSATFTYEEGDLYQCQEYIEYINPKYDTDGSLLGYQGFKIVTFEDRDGVQDSATGKYDIESTTEYWLVNSTQSDINYTSTTNSSDWSKANKVAKSIRDNLLRTYPQYIDWFNLTATTFNGDTSALTNYTNAISDTQGAVNTLADIVFIDAVSRNGANIPKSEWQYYLSYESLMEYAYDKEKDNSWKIDAEFQPVIDFHVLETLFNAYGEPTYAWVDKTDPTGNQDAYSKAQWYTNLYNRMQQGYTTLQDGLASSKEWIRFALESGLVVMEQVDSALAWKSFEYGACSDITEQTDTEAVTIAEAEYNRTMNKIKAKDQRYDLELKNIDTEHTSLQTEYESIKSVIEKNIGRTFKIYS